MQNAGYVIAGWVLTAAVLVAYAVSIAARTRRAERSLQQVAADDDQSRPWR